MLELIFVSIGAVIYLIYQRLKKRKRCPVCNYTKPINEFYKDEHSFDKHQVVCIHCQQIHKELEREQDEEVFDNEVSVLENLEYGTNLYINKKYLEALDIFNKVLNIDPYNEIAKYFLIKLKIKLQKD